MKRLSCQVVKFGGSLLDDDRLVAHWHRWKRATTATSTVLVVGGGSAVDVLRSEQKAQGFSDRDAHWRAIRAMGDNARRLAAMLELDPESVLVTRFDALAARIDSASMSIVDPLDLLRLDEPAAAGTPLPCSWDVTSDSIAARIAQMLHCPRLTLLKSALPGARTTYSAAAASGYVDRYFPTAAGWLESVTCVNLRSVSLEQQVLLRDGRTHNESLCNRVQH